MTDYTVTAGQTSTGIVLNDADTMEVQNGGTAVSTTVNAGGEQTVETGGTATGTTVNLGGTLFVSGGVASGAEVAGGVLSATSGSIVSASVLSGGVLSAYGSTETGTAVSSGGMQIIGSDVGDGDASGTTVLGGGVENLYGGTATGTTLAPGATLLASGGFGASGATIGSTDGTVIGNGAAEFVFSGYVASNTTLESGGDLVLLGGTETGTVNQGGQIISTGIIDYIPGQGYVVVGPTQSGAVLGSGTIQYVLPGGTAYGTVVGNGAQEQILGGTAFGTTVFDEGFVAISGGTAVNATVGSGGLFGVFSGGIASGTQVDSGGAAGIIEDGATMVDTTVNAGGVEALLFGGVANNTTVLSGGAVGVFSGTTNGTVLEDGAIEGLLAQGVASGTVLNSGSELVLISGGTATGTISAGGQIEQSGVFVYHIFSGASFYPLDASGVTIAGGALSEVFSGSALSGSLVSGGFAFIGTGGSDGTTPSDLAVDAGAQVASTTITGGATIEIDGSGSGLIFAGGASATVEYDGTDTGATVLGGATEDVHGSAQGTTVDSGGNQAVEYSGTATGTTVLAGGRQTVDQGATVSGTQILAGGALDAAGIGFSNGGTSFDPTTDTLTVDGPTGATVVQLAGDYSGETFAATSDGKGGTLVTVTGGPVLGAPTISGTTANNPTANEQPVQPFGGVTVADPNAGATETLTITLTGSNGGTLSDGGGQNGLTQTTPGNLGTYTLTGTPAGVSGELDALVFTPAPGGGTTTFTLTDRSSLGQLASDSTTAVGDNVPAGSNGGGGVSNGGGGNGGGGNAGGGGGGTVAGTGGGNAAAPPDTTPPTVSFDPTVSFSGRTTATLTGTVSDNVGVASVGIFESGAFLGAATVNPDGTWSFAAEFPPGFHTGLSAVATDTSGNSASASSDYNLTTGTRSGLKDQPYTTVQDSYDAGGAFLGQTFFKRNGAVLFSSSFTALQDGGSSYTYSGGSFFNGKAYSSLTDVYDANGTLTQDVESNRDGSHAIEVDADNQRVRSIGGDLFSTDGSSTHFVFTKGFGQDTIADFKVAGPGHDVLVLPPSDMSHLAQIIAGAQTKGGDTTLHIDRHDSIILQGVTAAQLRNHAADFKIA